MNPKKKPKFLRQEWFRMGNRRKKWMKWRSTRGNQSKLRMHIKGKGHAPNAGWGSPRSMRALHPSGLEEVLVSSIRQLGGLDPSRHAARIFHGVGGRKRKDIQAAADAAKIKVLNPRKVSPPRSSAGEKSKIPRQALGDGAISGDSSPRPITGANSPSHPSTGPISKKRSDENV